MNGFSLDFYDIFVNEVIGDATLFLIIGILIIIYFSLKRSIPMTATVLFCMLLVFIMNIKVAFPAIIALIAVVVGVIFFLGVAKILRIIQ